MACPRGVIPSVACLGWLGQPAKQFIDRHYNILTVTFFVLLALGFWAIRRLF